MSTFLYHPQKGAKIFELKEGQEDELYQEGWRDNPKFNDRTEPVERLSPEPLEDDTPQPPVNISMEQLSELVEFGETETEDGFELNVVDFVAPELKTECMPAADEVKSLEPGAKEESSLTDEAAFLLERFKNDPKDLTKDEHVFLGKNLGIKTMISSWSEDTLIKKINEQLANGDNEATD